jgi:signal recognition particle subunit SEC65
MSKDKGTTDLTGSEQKIKIDSSSSTNAAHHQTPQQQPDDVMRILQQLLTKQDQLLEENRQLKNQVALQQVTINNLSQVVDTLQINPPPHHDSTPNPSIVAATTSTVTNSTPNTVNEKFNLPQQAAKQLQSKRIDQLLNSTPFSGTMVQEVTDWFEEFNTKCDKLQFDDTQRLLVAVDLLKGNAKLWYETHKEGIDNWKTFTDKLTSYFQLVTGTDQFQLEQKLYNRRRQHYESAIDYCHNVLKLCSKVNKDMSEEKRIKHLIQGLNPNARLHMDLKNPNNTEEFLEALIKFDKWQMEEQNQQRTQLSADQRQYTSTRPSSQTYGPSTQQQTSKNHQPSYDQKQQNSYGQEYDGCWSCGGMDHYQYQCSKNY